MKIKTRLRLSYIAMLLIPVIMIMFIGRVTQNHYERSRARESYSPAFLSELYSVINNEPEKLLSEEYLEILSALSREKAVYFQVFKGDRKAISTYKGHSRSELFTDNWDFYFSDGTVGSLTAINPKRGGISGSFLSLRLMPLLVIAILIITNGILTWIVAGSILNPLYQLKAAANRIKEGDLNTPLKYEGQDEFQDLTNSFEEMRVRLLGSLNEQVKADENRKELLSNISHDLKTPITTIKGYVEGIRDGIADSPDKVSKYMDTIYRKSILMDEMIDSLLLYSRLDLNKVLFNFRDLDLTHFLKDICDDMQFDYPELEIEFTQEAPVFVVADLTNLHRVISNLIDNAVKYRSEQSPVVRISIEENKQDVTVRIKDNGRGIADDDIPHIFDRFYRADKARSSEIKGSGLGLAISKQIIESHGGRISAVRSAEGGTEIVFNLRRSK